MRLAGLGLLLSGWVILVAALPMLPHAGERAAFVTAGLLVEIVGLVLLGRDHRAGARGWE